MKKVNKLMIAAVLAVALPTGAMAAEADLQVKIDKLTQQLDDLKGQVQRVEDKSLGKWLTIGGSYQFRVDSLKGKVAAYNDGMGVFGYLGKNALYTDNVDMTGTLGPVFGAPSNMTIGQNLTLAMDGMQNVKTYQQAQAVSAAYQAMLMGLYMRTAGAYVAPPGSSPVTDPTDTMQIAAYKPKNSTIYTNKFALDLKAKATKDVTVNVKLGMYKVFGSQDDDAVTNQAYFADRVGVFDGTLGHVPSSSYLNVDRAYATWSNIAEEPIWFSVGRRPATDGAPTNLKSNNERPGNGGTPALLVNYAFDGMTIGYAPDIEMLPGFYAKVCYGRGFESGFKTEATNSVKDTDMLGVAVIPVDTDPLRVWLQWNRGFNIFDFPVMKNTAFGDTAPAINLGSIDWYGVGAMTTLKQVGPGNLNAFADFGLSRTNPNNNVSGNAMFQGLLTGAPLSPEAPKDKTGYGVFAGLRYDLPSKTKLGFEYNWGSKNWITFSPAADDMWTSKVGTRGQVFEPYVIQELNLKPVSSYIAKAFFKLGYQYYDFEYTGSNNWVGAPIKISELAAYQAANGMLLQAPVKSAQNIYGTFEVHF